MPLRLRPVFALAGALLLLGTAACSRWLSPSPADPIASLGGWLYTAAEIQLVQTVAAGEIPPDPGKMAEARRRLERAQATLARRANPASVDHPLEIETARLLEAALQTLSDEETLVRLGRWENSGDREPILSVLQMALSRWVETALQEQLEQELFQAVQSELARANLPPQDMPKRVIGIQTVSVNRYKVHMEMVRGEGWFEVWREGEQWRVRGLQPPGR